MIDKLTTAQQDALNREAEKRGLTGLVSRHFRRNGTHIKISGENPPWWMMKAIGQLRPAPSPPPPRRSFN